MTDKEKIANSIKALASETKRATTINTNTELLKLKQERELFEEFQKAKDRVEISLSTYESLKKELKDTKEELEKYKKWFFIISDKIAYCPDLSAEEKEKAWEKLLKDDFKFKVDNMWPSLSGGKMVYYVISIDTWERR